VIGTLITMATLVHGVDLVEIRRIESMLESHGDHFIDRVFTPAERAYADQGVAGRAERYAARFAAKEAVFKALGSGWSGGTAWVDVGVVHRVGGAPAIEISGHAAELAESMGITCWELSLTHTSDLAMASVVGLKTEEH
jgi:holo-[acyl-carrier protein] synthase